MEFQRYMNVDRFKADVFDILIDDEVCNNLPLGIIDGNRDTSANWLLSTVTDDQGAIILIAMCTPPFNLLLIEPKGAPQNNNASIELFAAELKKIGFLPSGVFSKSDLARRFADVYSGTKGSNLKAKLVLMKLDKFAEYREAPGYCRVLTEEDLSFKRSWEHSVCIECNWLVYTQKENEDRIKSRLGKDNHLIWVDGEPVSQAVCGRNTPNGAVVSWVYTPPQFRGRGYALSVVAEVSKTIFNRGKQFCCLFADTANPASQAVYRKLGYRDICVFDEIRFDMK